MNLKTKPVRDVRGSSRLATFARGCALVSCFACLIATTACGSSNTGTITGVYYGLAKTGMTHVGVPPVPIGSSPSSGKIRLKGLGGTFVTTAGSNGRFSITVPVGRYGLKAVRPGETFFGVPGCWPSHVVVRSGWTTNIAIRCSFHG